MTNKIDIKQKLFLMLYFDFMVKAVEDGVITSDEEEIIKMFLDNIPAETLKLINIQLVNMILEEIVKDEIITKEEEDLIIKCTSLFQLPELDNEIRQTINEYREVEAIKTDGIPVIQPSINISDTSDCYYDNTCMMKKTKTYKGDVDIIDDAKGQIIITAENLHLISNGHKKIKIKSIISVNRYSNNIVEMIIENRKTPIYFSVNNSLKAIAILKMLIS